MVLFADIGSPWKSVHFLIAIILFELIISDVSVVPKQTLRVNVLIIPDYGVVEHSFADFLYDLILGVA